MVDRPARVVAKALRPSRPVDQAARFSQPEGPGIFPPVPAAPVSAVPKGTTLARRLGPDENLLRQNCFHLTMKRSKLLLEQNISRPVDQPKENANAGDLKPVAAQDFNRERTVSEMRLALDMLVRTDDPSAIKQITTILRTNRFQRTDTSLDRQAATSIADILVELDIPFVFAGNDSQSELPDAWLLIRWRPIWPISTAR